MGGPESSAHLGETVIDCRSVSLTRGAFHLGPLDLEIAGGVTVLLGRNGAGKTTFLRSLMGLEKLNSGSIEVGGMNIADRKSRRSLMRRVGFAPQVASLPGASRVGETVAYAAWLKGVPRSRSAAAVSEALEIVNIGDFMKRRNGELSGGQRQRVSIAMAVVHDPDVLLLDEPSAGLDPVQRLSLRNVIDGIAEHRAVVHSTHLIEEVHDDRGLVVVLRDGEIAFSGTGAEIKDLGTESSVGATDLERGVWNLLGGEGPE